MAYLQPQKNRQQGQLQRGQEPSLGSAPSATQAPSTGSAPQAAKAPAQPASQFDRINAFIGSNQTQGSAMADKLKGQVSEEANSAASGLDKSRSDWTSGANQAGADWQAQNDKGYNDWRQSNIHGLGSSGAAYYDSAGGSYAPTAKPQQAAWTPDLQPAQHAAQDIRGLNDIAGIQQQVQGGNKYDAALIHRAAPNASSQFGGILDQLENPVAPVDSTPTEYRTPEQRAQDEADRQKKIRDDWKAANPNYVPPPLTGGVG
jgi:hypothetical protein